MNQTEVWKDVKNYEGHYQVSSLGRVKSLKLGKERILKNVKACTGYLYLCLCKKGDVKKRSTHSIVAESFLNHTIGGRKIVVNHINFNREDNRVENLEVVTMRENTNQKHMKSSSKYTGVCWSKYHRKWSATIWINKKGRHIGYFSSEYKAHLAYQNELKKLIDE